MPSIHAIMQSGNLYAFAINNPIMWIDPSGLFITRVFDEFMRLDSHLINLVLTVESGIENVFRSTADTVTNLTPRDVNVIAGTVAMTIATKGLFAKYKALTFSPSLATTTVPAAVGQVSPQVDLLIRNAGTLNRTTTVMSNVATRPYIHSTQLIQEIMRAAPPTPDPRSTTGLRWVVEGTFNLSQGAFELVIDPATHTIWHFLFTSR